MAAFLIGMIRSLSIGFHHQSSSSQATATLLPLIVAAIFSLNLGLSARVVDGVVDQSACGPGSPNGKRCDSGNCCSFSNFCGPPQTHCGPGCQPDYSAPGLCTAANPGSAPSGPSSPVCGREASNINCGNNLCCSEFGFCGSTGDYCYKANGCQSQCKYSPQEIGAIVGGTLGGFSFLCVVVLGMYKWYRKYQGKKTINKKNIEPVHRLFPTNEAQDKDTCLDIVFCHGFGFGELEKDAWRNTWRLRQDKDVCWAEDWLGSDLQGKARVFSLEYDANVSSDPSRKGYNTDVRDIASNLLRCIFGTCNKIGQENAVVLIGHSFGGLVMKSLVVEAQRLAQLTKPTNNFERAQVQSCRNFLSNIEGFIFYAVPHSGAQNLEKYIKNICDNMLKRSKRLLQAHGDNSPSLFSNIKAFSREMEELSVKFESIVRAYGERKDDLIIYAFTECLPMTQGDVDVIVEHGSAVRGSGYNHYKIETANHMTVCQYFSREDESYRQLLGVLETVITNHPHPRKSNSTTSDPGHLSTGQLELGDRSLSDLEDQGKSFLHEGSVKSAPDSTFQKLGRLGSKLRNPLPRAP